jgi:hypothetical protein
LGFVIPVNYIYIVITADEFTVKCVDLDFIFIGMWQKYMRLNNWTYAIVILVKDVFVLGLPT